eukprot:TRINITY_DN85536_c0_g1_i1.p1 TRINITY_DN85536_c0_g1~~TRINITY_DN85536_c0_g1_i1.p1  ORF type:complete len:579 (-),score=58.83 TRINITY_DN85536_c0_g1_i1:85-1821(-)
MALTLGATTSTGVFDTHSMYSLAASGQPDLTQVHKTIWIGARTALQSRILHERGIRYVCNTSKELIENSSGIVDWNDLQANGIVVLHTRWDDNHTQHIYPFSQTTEEALNFIQQAVQTGQHVLVNCSMGISRSSSLVCAYMIAREGFSFESALSTLRAKRPIVSPNFNFYNQLSGLEQAMRAQGATPGAATSTNYGAGASLVRADVDTYGFPSARSAATSPIDYISGVQSAQFGSTTDFYQTPTQTPSQGLVSVPTSTSYWGSSSHPAATHVREYSSSAAPTAQPYPVQYIHQPAALGGKQTASNPQSGITGLVPQPQVQPASSYSAMPAVIPPPMHPTNQTQQRHPSAHPAAYSAPRDQGGAYRKAQTVNATERMGLPSSQPMYSPYPPPGPPGPPGGVGGPQPASTAPVSARSNVVGNAGGSQYLAPPPGAYPQHNGRPIGGPPAASNGYPPMSRSQSSTGMAERQPPPSSSWGPAPPRSQTSAGVGRQSPWGAAPPQRTSSPPRARRGFRPPKAGGSWGPQRNYSHTDSLGGAGYDFGYSNGRPSWQQPQQSSYRGGESVYNGRSHGAAAPSYWY